jgi:hypothetical protein
VAPVETPATTAKLAAASVPGVFVSPENKFLFASPLSAQREFFSPENTSRSFLSPENASRVAPRTQSQSIMTQLENVIDDACFDLKKQLAASQVETWLFQCKYDEAMIKLREEAELNAQLTAANDEIKIEYATLVSATAASTAAAAASRQLADLSSHHGMAKLYRTNEAEAAQAEINKKTEELKELRSHQTAVQTLHAAKDEAAQAELAKLIVEIGYPVHGLRSPQPKDETAELPKGSPKAEAKTTDVETTKMTAEELKGLHSYQSMVTQMARTRA